MHGALRARFSLNHISPFSYWLYHLRIELQNSIAFCITGCNGIIETLPLPAAARRAMPGFQRQQRVKRCTRNRRLHPPDNRENRRSHPRAIPQSSGTDRESLQRRGQQRQCEQRRGSRKQVRHRRAGSRKETTPGAARATQPCAKRRRDRRAELGADDACRGGCRGGAGSQARLVGVGAVGGAQASSARSIAGASGSSTPASAIGQRGEVAGVGGAARRIRLRVIAAVGRAVSARCCRARRAARQRRQPPRGSAAWQRARQHRCTKSSALPSPKPAKPMRDARHGRRAAERAKHSKANMV